MIHTVQIAPPADRSVNGSIVLNGSKSISNRVLIIHALTAGTFNIENLSNARDTELLQEALHSNSFFLDVGAGGTTYRFLTAYLAIRPGEYILTGSDRMKERPIRVLVDALRSLGAEIDYLENEGYPPLKISGQLRTGGKVMLPGDVSSQYLTALLLIAPSLEGGLELEWTGQLVSRPYIMMTLNLMEHFGAEWSMDDQSITVKQGRYTPRDFYVEGDWSAASYFYAIAALSEQADIELVGLESDSVQGDAVIAYMMESFQVKSEYDARSKSVRLSKQPGETPWTFTYDFIECPDLAQTTAAAMTGLKVDSVFSGLMTLKIKETDRVAALREELLKFGAKFEETGEDEWMLNCYDVAQPVHRPVIRTYEDHRMAMALAPLCLRFGALIIENPDVVAKSYPKFWEDMRKLGFEVT
jgi:3-phosphoshikimate 1-carboxyvinyltransferase